jgi:hypothetical protein
VTCGLFGAWAQRVARCWLHTALRGTCDMRGRYVLPPHARRAMEVKIESNEHFKPSTLRGCSAMDGGRFMRDTQLAYASRHRVRATVHCKGVSTHT